MTQKSPFSPVQGEQVKARRVKTRAMQEQSRVGEQQSHRREEKSLEDKQNELLQKYQSKFLALLVSYTRKHFSCKQLQPREPTTCSHLWGKCGQSNVTLMLSFWYCGQHLPVTWPTSQKKTLFWPSSINIQVKKQGLRRGRAAVCKETWL